MSKILDQIKEAEDFKNSSENSDSTQAVPNRVKLEESVLECLSLFEDKVSSLEKRLSSLNESLGSGILNSNKQQPSSA